MTLLPIDTMFTSIFQTLETIYLEAKRKKYPLWIFLALLMNLILAPAVYAASTNAISRDTAFAIGLLGIVTIGLGIYLFTVILQPEKF